VTRVASQPYWAINARLCCLPVDPRNARQRSADICDLSCCKSMQCANVAETNYLAGDKQVPSAPAKLYYVARNGRPWHMILISILVSRMALTFTMQMAGNKLILFYRYLGTTMIFFRYRGTTVRIYPFTAVIPR